MNIKKKTTSINFKVLLYLIVFSVSILLLLWFFQIIYLAVSYEHYQVKTMNKIATTIEDADEEQLYETLLLPLPPHDEQVTLLFPCLRRKYIIPPLEYI